MSKIPPNRIIKILELICPAHLTDEIGGDLLEYYAGIAEKNNINYANRKALEFLLRSAPRLIVNRKYHTSNNRDMLRNYFVIAIRNLKRNLGYASINIIGLAVGLACCLLIGIYVIHELSFDTFHEKSDNVFRVNMTFNDSGTSYKTFMTPTALLPNLKREFNDIQGGSRVFNVSQFSPVVVQKEDVKYQEEQFLYVDSTFLDLFSFTLIIGNPEQCLTAPRSLLLTQKSAKKYFGEQDALGEVIKVDGRDYTITGVLENLPNNSHIRFDFLASFSSIRASKSEIWDSANYATYISLSNPQHAGDLEGKISKLVVEKAGLEDGELTFELMPLTKIHLYSDLSAEMQPQNDIKYIYIISAIGLLILIIACINYINLATARAADRAREVGMRKVLGAIRRQVFYQFMGESTLITATAMLIAMIIVNFSISPFNQLTGKELNTGDIFNGPILTGLVLTFFIVSFLAGAYPALSLSSFSSSMVLKGNFKRSKRGGWLRQVLVVLQFSISIFLIIGTLVINKQLHYMHDKRLGYNKENVLVLPTDNVVNDNFQTIKTELEKRDDVLTVSRASESPTDIGGGYGLQIPGLTEKAVHVTALTVDQSFIQAMGMKLVSGRNYTDADFTLATKEAQNERYYGFIVNQQLVKQLVLDEEAIIGRKVSLNGRQGEILAVVEDFHFTSLRREIDPLVLFIEPWQFNKIFIRIKPQHLQSTLSAIEDNWKSIVPNRPFIFNFMDDEYDAMYRSEARLGNIFTVFAVLAIIIACLGLFGLVSYAVEQRNKEIGVRKVLGASVGSLFLLVSKDFSKLVLLAFFVAGPIGYWLMYNWLMDFEYRTNVGFLPIILSVICALGVAFLTVSYQSIKAAMKNPVETLRTE